MNEENSHKAASNDDEGVIKGYSAVAVYKTIDDLTAALNALKEKGFNMEKVSVVGHGLDKAVLNVDTEEEFHDHTLSGKKAATIWGSILGVGAGVGILAIPGVNGLVAIGTAAAYVFGALEIVGISTIAGAFAGTLVGVGVHERRAKHYAKFVEAGNYLLVAEGEMDDAEKAEKILEGTNSMDVELDE